MSIVETFHAAHKARLSRLGAIPEKPELPLSAEFRQQLNDLQAKADRQSDIIAELYAIIAKQRTVIRKFADETDAPRPRIADVIAAVSDHYKISKRILIGSDRNYEIAFARQVGYHVCRQIGFPFLAIGRAFFKDHSSAVHGSQKIALRLQDDANLAQEIQKIMTAIDIIVARRVQATKEALS